jgi:uncharacterized protein YndB with AHSA1/START domain
MTTVDLSRIVRTVEIAAPPDRVWRALTNVTELSAWFQVTIEGSLAPDSEIWMTSTHKGFEGQRFAVRIVEMTPPRRFVWQWHPGEVDPAVQYSNEPRTTVTFTLEANGLGTRLTVSESGFDAISLARRARVFTDNNQGWPEVLEWLRKHVEAAR